LKKERGPDHYTWTVRNVLGMIHTWRHNNNIKEPIEYIFDWIEPYEPRRKEIEAVFASGEDDPESQKLFGVYKGCCQFRDRCDVLPLQASDLLAWTLYRGIQHKNQIKKVNEIAAECIADFTYHRRHDFIEGGDTNRRQIAEWVARATHRRRGHGSTAIR
jgi:hypothetical protein